MSHSVILPGATIGIIGGGQLGSMSAVAAASLGYTTHIFCPDAHCPAFHVSHAHTVADYTDLEALEAFSSQVDVVTFEFENIPHESVQALEKHVPVRPGWEVLYTCRNRLREKRFINKQGISTAPFAEINTEADLMNALNDMGYPAIMKTMELGYDGKGQVKLQSPDDIDSALAIIAGGRAILEGFIRFEKETSVIVARGLDGTIKCHPAVENIHTNHILATTIAPASIHESVRKEAEQIAITLAESLSLVGIIAVEMFVTSDNKVLVNELAPRPHNSGHYSLDACSTSQFEQFIRAVCGLPLGETTLLCPSKMINLIGDDVINAHQHLENPLAKLHLYRKGEPRPGRKMGHVTLLQPEVTD